MDSCTFSPFPLQNRERNFWVPFILNKSLKLLFLVESVVHYLLLTERLACICSYLAPEYFQHGKVSDKTDVYAFGVVLLELISGRKPIEAKRGPGEENLVVWVGH